MDFEKGPQCGFQVRRKDKEFRKIDRWRIWGKRQIGNFRDEIDLQSRKREKLEYMNKLSEKRWNRYVDGSGISEKEQD